MNIILAYVLFTASQVMGVQQELGQDQIAKAPDSQVELASVQPGSPAEKAGFKAGDIFKNESVVSKTMAISYSGKIPQGYTTLIGLDTAGDPINFTIQRNGKPLTIIATPQAGIIQSAPKQPALGFVVTAVGTIKIPLAQAPVAGLYVTWNATKETALGLYGFFKNIVLFKADLSQVSGPIGIAGAVGNASAQGFATLLSLTALISINLALINLIPIPALDGGRLLFVLIEAITLKPINPKIAERVNMVGFALLILLMFVVSAHDIYKLIVP